jgi:hypothetical protein
MATASNPKWTSQHDDALAGLTALKLPPKEARALLEGLGSADTGDLIMQALRNRHKGKAAMSVPGGPANAAPINKQSTPPPLPFGGQQMQLPRNMPPLPGQQPQMPPPLPKAPIGPAAAQLQPTMPVAAHRPEKPRIRVRAAGGPVPAAPIGGAGPSVGASSPTNAPETPTEAQQPPTTQQAAPPRIRSEDEYDKLAPGTEFVWIPDGHIYRKPAEGGEK